MFKPLALEEIRQIVGKLADGLRARLADRQVGLVLTDAAVRFISKEGFDPVYGARPLKRFIQRSLETPVARALIAGEAEEGSVLTVDLEDGKLSVAIRYSEASPSTAQ
ncbi:Chaperone protein ClpB [compost metagenome]